MSTQDMDAILVELSKPFHPAHVTWKPGVFNRDKTKALALAYADLRAYQNRLDEVCGMNWAVNYTPWGDRIVCHLTINGVTRSSTGESDQQSERSEIAGTAAEAQAFKRACAMFGLGRYLYNLPTIWAEFDSERRQFTEQGKGRLNGVITQHYRRHVGNEATESRSDGRAVTDDVAVDDAPNSPSSNGTEPEEASQPQTAPPQPTAKLESENAALNVLRSEFDELGAALYGHQWPQVRRHNVERISGGAVTDAENLGENELKRLINGLKKIQRTRKEPA